MMRARLAAGVLLAVCAAGLSPSAADELPIRKPGLWEIKLKLTGGAAPTATMRHCTDESVDRQMSTLFNPLAPPPCPKSSVRKEGDHYTIESGCRIDDRVIKITSDVSGDFSSAYSVVTETKTQDTPDSEPTLTSMTMEARHAGSCKWGQKPGDVVMAGGMKINVREMENFKKRLTR